MDKLYESSRLINSYESIPRNYGTEDQLYMVEVHTLDLIGKNRRITVSKIAKRVDRTVSAVSQKVNILITKGLVFKYRDNINYREFLLDLTPKGEIIYHFHENLDEIEYGKNLSKLDKYSDSDFQTFIQMTEIINLRIKRVIDGKESLGK